MISYVDLLRAMGFGEYSVAGVWYHGDGHCFVTVGAADFDGKGAAVFSLDALGAAGMVAAVTAHLWAAAREIGWDAGMGQMESVMNGDY